MEIHSASSERSKHSAWRVFLSSTEADLAEHRKAVSDAVLRLKHVPEAMETFVAEPNSSVESCRQRVRESDAMVAMVAHRYGWMPDDEDEKSITWLEVEAALDAGIPVFAFLVDEAHPWPFAKEQDRLTHHEVQIDPEGPMRVMNAVRRLTDFRNWLRGDAGLVVDTFTTPEDLAAKVTAALALWAAERSGTAELPRQREVEFRVVHPLQPAPHFQGRERLLESLFEWWEDAAHPDRVRSLVAVGGAGKTAIAERFLRAVRSRPPKGSTLVWSFYERPDAGEFLREACDLFLGEEGDAGGRLERLQRVLRAEGTPHLLVLDGLERIQEEASETRARGELSDHTLRLFLQVVAQGLGRTRALVTSRFPLADLADFEGAGYRSTELDDLEPDVAIAVLEGWGVLGSQERLGELAASVGHHALSTAVLGSYIGKIGGGDPSFAVKLELDRVKETDRRAAKLGRILADYARVMPNDELDLLVRLSVFPRGVSARTLGFLVDAGGRIAGALVRYDDAKLIELAERLRDRGLVFRYDSGSEIVFTAHPFLREHFQSALAVPTEEIHEVIRTNLAPTLEARPGSQPTDPEVLDRFEELIEHTLLAGREQEAFKLYGSVGPVNFLHTLGEFERGVRILSRFSLDESAGAIADPGQRISARRRGTVANNLGLYLDRLGHLDRSARVLSIARALDRNARKAQNSWENLMGRGKIVDALVMAEQAVELAASEEDDHLHGYALAAKASSQHALGDTVAARTSFAEAGEVVGVLRTTGGIDHACHLFDIGKLEEAISALTENRRWCLEQRFVSLATRCDARLARMALERSFSDAQSHLGKVRDWTSKSGELRLMLEAHFVAGELARRMGSYDSALTEASAGVVHARTCGYVLLEIELRTLLARVHLDTGHSRRALREAREAHDLATDDGCRWAWGIADAAHLCGVIHQAMSEIPQARRRLEEALDVRRRIQHPKADETAALLESL